ncbi:MAG: hypothetical protein Kow0027_23050 [Saprospiraceae bacterium]
MKLEWLIFFVVFAMSCGTDKMSSMGSESSDKKEKKFESKEDDQEGELQFYSLKPNKEYDSACGKYFFARVEEFESDGQSIFIADGTGGQVLVVDRNFDNCRVIGKSGEGPGEFKEPQRIAMWENALAVYGCSGQSICLFTKDGAFINSIKVGLLASKFAFDGQYIYFSSPAQQKGDIFSLATTTGKITPLCKYKFSHLKDEEKYFRSRMHILLHNDQLLCVGDSEPNISIFTKDGHLIKEYDFSDMELFKKFYKNLEMRRRREGYRQGMSYLLFQDVELNADKLYCLMYQYNEEGYPTLNHVLVMKSNHDNIRPEALYELKPVLSNEKSWNLALAVNQNSLLTFDLLSAKFVVYPLP